MCVCVCVSVCLSVSRLFRINILGFYWNSSLIPLADMANHLPSGGSQRDVPAETRGIIHMEFDDANMMIVISLEGTSVKAQQQIYYNYGKHGNDRLLSNYGFTVWPNRYHCIQLLMDAPAQDEDLKKVALCDGSIGLTREAWRYYRLLSLSVPSQEQSLRERWAENDKRGVGSVATEFVDLISEIKALVSPSFIPSIARYLLSCTRLILTDEFTFFCPSPPFSVTLSEKYQPRPRQGGPAEGTGAAYPHSARTRLANVCPRCKHGATYHVFAEVVLPHQLAVRANASPTLKEDGQTNRDNASAAGLGPRGRGAGEVHANERWCTWPAN
jgi:hypothetical protein